MLPDDGSPVENGAAADQGAGANPQGMLMGLTIQAEIHAIFSQDAVRADQGILSQGYAGTDEGIAVDIASRPEGDMILNDAVMSQGDPFPYPHILSDHAVLPRFQSCPHSSYLL